MQLWNRQWTRKELLDRVGSLSQLGGITRFEYADGKAKGVTAIRVRSAAGLEFSVLPERGMDIVEASYLGKSLSWHSPIGVTHPAYYDPRDIQWIKTFPGGLVCTCGLTTAGPPCEDAGEVTGLHGPVSNLPADHVSFSEQWIGDDCNLVIQGEVRETRVHGPNLLLQRTISTSLASKTIVLSDKVENQGFSDSPLMLIYHLNFGFPLLTEKSRIYAPSEAVEPRSEFAAPTMKDWATFDAPMRGIGERVYYHKMRATSDGHVSVVLVSDDGKRDFGILVRYAKANLPEFIQWKMTGVNHFVLGLEPSNCRVGGRLAERQAGTLTTLAPGEKREFSVELSVLDGKHEVEQAIAASSIS
jgi:hypothetical protein